MDTHAIIGKALGDKYAEAKRRRRSLPESNFSGFMECSNIMSMIWEAYYSAFLTLLDAGHFDAAGSLTTAYWDAVKAGERVSA